MFASHNRSRDSERHFLSRANHLGPAHHQAAATHLRQHFTNALVHFLAFDHVRLKSAVKFAVDRPNSQANQIRILLQRLLQPRVIAAVV